MKNFKFYHVYLLLFVFSGLLLNSCEDNNDPEQKQYENYMSSELKVELTSQQAIANFIKLSPEAVALSPLIRFDVEVRAITYKTIYKEKNIQASGLVCLPKTPGNYPVLSFQHGTIFLHSEAPSVKENDDLFSVMESLTAMGFIVVIPDYIGFGESSNLPHPYLDAKSSTQCILDMIRATKEYTTDDKVEAKATNDLFIFGYSQGGWATLQVQKSIEKDYSSEFNLIASSCGAGPYSIEYMNKYMVEKTEFPPCYMAYLLNAYKTTGLITNPLSDMIQQPYAGLIPGLFDGNNTVGTINSKLTAKVADLLTTEYRTGYATDAKFAGLRSSFLSNSITAWNISTPTKLYHCKNDEVVPYGMSEKMLADFQTKGVSSSKIELVSVSGTDHISGAYSTGTKTILWFLSLMK